MYFGALGRAIQLFVLAAGAMADAWHCGGVQN
jgi:hypothetical protein